MTNRDMEDSEQLRLARRLKEAREYLGLSQETVAEKLQVPRASISAFENGRRKVSGLELRKLAALYKTTVAHLLEEEVPQDSEVVAALFRTAVGLSDEDKGQVLRFARFLREASAAGAADLDQDTPDREDGRD